MNNTWFNVPEKDSRALWRISIGKRPTGLEKGGPLAIGTPAYFSGAGGLNSTAEDYLQFAQMLANGGQLNGKRILSPWTVGTMLSNNVGDLFNGQIGRPPKGVGFRAGRRGGGERGGGTVRKPDGSYGWDGAYGTYWWVNRKEQMVAVCSCRRPAGRCSTTSTTRFLRRSSSSGGSGSRLLEQRRPGLRLSLT